MLSIDYSVHICCFCYLLSFVVVVVVSGFSAHQITRVPPLTPVSSCSFSWSFNFSGYACVCVCFFCDFNSSPLRRDRFPAELEIVNLAI